MVKGRQSAFTRAERMGVDTVDVSDVTALEIVVEADVTTTELLDVSDVGVELALP